MPSTLPATIPIFPLPNVVLFANVFLPLHIFEARYRAMVADALAGDRIIGMVLLQPGYEIDYEGRPPVYPIGCAGVITHADPLADGRYNIVLRGIEKFRIIGEDDSRSYRMATIEALPETLPDGDRVTLRQQRQRLEAVLVAAIERSGADPKFPPAIPDEELVNALAQYLDLQPIERQALLECEGTLARCRALIELLEMKTLAPRGTAWNSSVH
ncbi:MAG TPA: LON peptidase substrate-binding domain-containing protein [Vicinamibacterales bacterium]|nr:LON peptidase substrate-binding domain-containing protein [Vicinamibacterales bacterium]